jgi:hypothetical protein
LGSRIGVYQAMAGTLNSTASAVPVIPLDTLPEDGHVRRTGTR